MKSINHQSQFKSTEPLNLGNLWSCANIDEKCIPKFIFPYFSGKYACIMTTVQHPIPAPRTQKGREVARSNLDSVDSANLSRLNSVDTSNLSRLERILMASRNEDLNLAALITGKYLVMILTFLKKWDKYLVMILSTSFLPSFSCIVYENSENSKKMENWKKLKNSGKN